MTHDAISTASSAGNTRKYPGNPMYFRAVPGVFGIFCLLTTEQQ